MQIAAADAQLTVHERRIVENEESIPGRRTIIIDQFERLAGDGLGQLLWIRDGSRAADELRVRSVELAHSFEPAQDVRKMAAVHAPIKVKLIDNEVLQVLE